MGRKGGGGAIVAGNRHPAGGVEVGRAAGRREDIGKEERRGFWVPGEVGFWQGIVFGIVFLERGTTNEKVKASPPKGKITTHLKLRYIFRQRDLLQLSEPHFHDVEDVLVTKHPDNVKGPNV